MFSLLQNIFSFKQQKKQGFYADWTKADSMCVHDDVTYVCMMMWQHKKQGFYADGTKVDSTGWLSLRTQLLASDGAGENKQDPSLAVREYSFMHVIAHHLDQVFLIYAFAHPPTLTRHVAHAACVREHAG